MSTKSRTTYIVLAVYVLVVLLLLPTLPLWLDEILDLRGARDLDLANLMRYVRTNSGGVPLGYLAQFATVHLLGFSRASGRLPSAIFSVGSVMGIFFLVRRYGQKAAFWSALLFAAFPLQIRYAVEARPYSQALCTAIWATALFCMFAKAPRASILSAYILLIVAGLYTQPYSFFVPITHFAWLCFRPAGLKDPRSTTLLVGLALATSALLFFPWYWYAANAWHESTTAYCFSFSIKSILLIGRELVGSGYLGTAFVLGFALYGLSYMRRENASPLFWILWGCLPIFLALLVDKAEGYFIAVRQFIYVLPALAVLCGFGITRLLNRRTRWSKALLGMFLIVLATESMHFFLKPHEDWDLAAHSLADADSDQQTCIIFAPADSGFLYSFFLPSLNGDVCTGNDIGRKQAIEVAVSPYAGAPVAEQIFTRLGRSGYKRTESKGFNGPSVFRYVRVVDSDAVK